MSPIRLSSVALYCALGASVASCAEKLHGIGPGISVSPATLAFGTIAAHAQAQVRVDVANTGSSTLQINSVKPAGDAAGELAVLALFTTDCHDAPRSGATALAPGECARFTAVWSPRAAHDVAGGIAIDSSDPDAGLITLPATGTATSAPACTPDCSATQACCGATCVDTQTDPLHCGGCSPCAQGQTCNGGVCKSPAPATSCDDLTAPCTAGDKCCDHTCVDVSRSGGLCPCTGPGGTSNFGVGSIIIPMDYCWQRGVDTGPAGAACSRNAKQTADDAPLKAYGLIFFLIRHQVTVYVAINPFKTAIDGVDMTLTTFDGTPPVLRYSWATGQPVPFNDATQNTVSYRGGPFLIDASQHDRVLQLLAHDSDFAQFRTAGNITLHVSRVGFQSPISKTIAAVPSRVALLSPADGGDTLQILERYLASAGLDYPGARGTPDAPGEIYDELSEDDFVAGKLKSGGYKLLWAPHWEGGTSKTSAQLAAIADYVDSGGDLFAECAAIGTLEGMASGFRGTSTVPPGSAATRFLTDSGLTGNNMSLSNNTVPGPYSHQGITSVFAQSGDFLFSGDVGYVTDYHPDPGARASYRPGVVRYLSGIDRDRNPSELFASIDQRAQGKGTVVYLAGHDYSYQSTRNGGQRGSTAGSRLVLNTLFSLGANNVCAP